MRLRPPTTRDGAARDAQRRGERAFDEFDETGRLRERRPEYRPGEFERYVQKLVAPPPPPDTVIRRFGAELMTDLSGDAQDFNPLVPPDYLVMPGDELMLTLWGSVDADLRLGPLRPDQHGGGRHHQQQLAKHAFLPLGSPSAGAARRGARSRP